MFGVVALGFVGRIEDLLIGLARDDLAIDFDEPAFEACGAVAETILARDPARDQVVAFAQVAGVVDAEADRWFGRGHGG